MHIKGKTYAIGVIGKKENMNFDVLRSFGKVEEKTLEEIFGY